MVRVGITGLNFTGRAHLDHYLGMRNVDVAAVCDIREEAIALEEL